MDDAWNPNPDRAAATLLGDALRAVKYTTDAIEELLGEDGPSADLAESVLFERRLPSSKIATTVQLLLLQRPTPTDAVTHALGGDSVDALLTLGFVTEEGGELVPRARIVPSEGIYLAFDGFSHGENDPPGWVASFSPTAYWLACLTPRRRVGRALDLGTGNGAHALLAARHSEHVIATDVNERALGFTDIGAALNRITNVETRLGSLFEPVEGETFDLITCNAPYVVSPESRWEYRDGGMQGDELSERVVRDAPRHLAPGGHASVLVSWVAEHEDEPDERVLDWLDGNGCDAWILGLSGADPLDHAAGWNEHFSGDTDQMGEALDDWSSYFERLDVGWITEGAVLMRRRDADHHLVRVDPVEEEELEFASDQIERVFTALRLTAERGAAVVEELRLRLAEEVRFRQELDRRGELQDVVVLLDEGTCAEEELEPGTAQVLTTLDGQTTLEKAVERTARRLDLDRRELAHLRADTLKTVRELFELGFFEVVG